MAFAVFITGLSTVIIQTLLIREMLAFFCGNELISGIILFLWLCFTGFGSILYSRIQIKIEPKKVYAFLLFLLTFALIFSFIFIRIAPHIFALPFGEVIGFHKIILISVITLFPTCVIIGSLFPAGSRIIKPQLLYLIEGFGSFIGGMILSFILLSILPPSGIIVLLILLLLLANALLVNKKYLFILGFLPLLLYLKIYSLELFLRRLQFPGQNLISVYESKYGSIIVTKDKAQLNFYTNGYFDFSYPDIFSAEEAVHYPLLIHKNPEDILLIGGGLGGGIEEILKHKSVKRLVYLELDPELIRAGKVHIHRDFSDKRLHFVIGDGRFYVKKTREEFDCIIINLPDPVNAQLNRYYTYDFFKEAKRILKNGGIFSIRVNYTPDILSPLYSQFLGTINNTLHKVFRNIYILPASKAVYIATDYEIEGSIREVLKSNIRARNIELVYVNEYFFDYNLSEERISYLKKSVQRAKKYINLDLKPICYYFSTVLWGGITSEDLKGIFIKLFNLHPLFFFLPLLVVIFLWRRKSIIYLSVFTFGATEISLEILLIILFQVIYGYIYNWIGIIISLFMLGLSSGTLLYLKLKKLFFENKNRMHLLSLIQFVIALYLFLILFIGLTRIKPANIIIAVSIFISGFWGGLHFPLAVEIQGEEKAGFIYGIDLLGASLFAFITTFIFIPILGILITAIFLMTLNLLVSIGLRF
jgi:spermidine synthase